MSVSLENALLLLARLLLAAIFLHEGFTLISGYTAASAYMARFGVPAILLAPTIAVQLGGFWEADYQVRFPASCGRTSGAQVESAPKPTIRRFNAARGLLIANVR